ncbi:MAG: DUF294 nucleotidyltransferase-like domain-containing protein, partial [Verrucomicrobiota bacterium]
LGSLVTLRDRADTLLFEYLETEVEMDFLMRFVAEVDGVVLERTLRLATDILEAQGLSSPDVPYCWLAMHSEGRRERLIRSSQRTALVYAEPPSGQERYVRRWFLHLAEEVSHLLASCGFAFDTGSRMASNTRWCQSLKTWMSYYSRWIHNPIDSNIISLTPFFDLRAVYGDSSLATRLRQHIQDEIASNPSFIPLLANDAMANLPPVTIFRDSVMDKEGILWTSIDTKMHAMYPLVDVGRVFALQNGLQDCTNTVQRYRRMAEIMPGHSEIFLAASDAMRKALSMQSLIGHRRGDAGQFIRPHELNKIDQERLKSIFRTIVGLLDFSSQHFQLSKS